MDIKEENAENEKELERKQSYKNKLEEDIPKAEEYENQTRQTYNDAVAARQAKQEECAHKARYYADENVRRAEELEAIDACIRIFEEDLSEVSDYTEARAEGDFEETATPDREIYNYDHDRTEYEETGGYTHSIGDL
jgi:hypothetical protein